MTIHKPVIFVASAYTGGDPAINTHFQCRVFNEMMDDGKVWPVVPLWTHFQHTLFPRPYQDWLAYDQALLRLYHGCLRLTARFDSMNYVQEESSGADKEVAAFLAASKPVFYNLPDLYRWVEEEWPKQSTHG